MGGELATHKDVVHQKGDNVWDFSNVRDFDENLCSALGVFLAIWGRAERRTLQKLACNGAVNAKGILKRRNEIS